MSIQLIPYKPAGTIGSGPYVLREYKPDTGVDISALSITYTGAHTDYGMVTMSDGARYRLLAFTASGTLSIEQPVNCEVCVVGGGANGKAGKGGAGAHLKNQSVSAYSGGPVVVGARQGVSSIADVSVNKVSGQNGGTGGGGYDNGNGGTGDGLSKYPFGDATYTLWASKPHCAGGGGGVACYKQGDRNYDYYTGGNGGTNGGNGNKSTYGGSSGPTYSGTPGTGGTYGGGLGGASNRDGSNATYYGSAGGGAASAQGSGYQGIVYIRIPEEQAA